MGTFICVTGVSGSGKSTFLEIICGLLETSEGSIICDNKEFNQKKNIFKYCNSNSTNWDIIPDYHFGGFNKVNDKQIEKYV